MTSPACLPFSLYLVRMFDPNIVPGFLHTSWKALDPGASLKYSDMESPLWNPGLISYVYIWRQIFFSTTRGLTVSLLLNCCNPVIYFCVFCHFFGSLFYITWATVMLTVILRDLTSDSELSLSSSQWTHAHPRPSHTRRAPIHTCTHLADEEWKPQVTCQYSDRKKIRNHTPCSHVIAFSSFVFSNRLYTQRGNMEVSFWERVNDSLKAFKEVWCVSL